jgi:hypothetical protein
MTRKNCVIHANMEMGRSQMCGAKRPGGRTCWRTSDFHRCVPDQGSRGQEEAGAWRSADCLAEGRGGIPCARPIARKERWPLRQHRQHRLRPYWAPAGVGASQVDSCRRKRDMPEGCCSESAPDPLSLTLLTVLTVFSGNERIRITLRSAGATAVYFDESKSRVCSFYPAGTKRGRRQLSLIYGLLNLQRARLFDPVHAALDGPLVPRRFPQSTPLQRFQEPCEWQTRWQMSSPSSRRPIPHGGLSRG